MSRKIAIILSLAIIAICSCKKDTTTTPDAPDVSGSAKTIIINNINDSIKVTLSGLDLLTGTIPHIIDLTLPPNDTSIIPRTGLKDGTRYSITWHSKNYRYSDWFHFVNGSKKSYEFDYKADSTDYTVSIAGKNRNDLLICLDGDGISSEWTAVNAFDNSGSSVWAGLNNRQKAHNFSINRFHTIKHNFIDTNNKAKFSQLSFSLYDSTAHFSLATNSIDKYILSSNITFLAPLNTQAIDTIYYCSYYTDSNNNIHYSDPYYQLIRTSVDR